MYVLLSYSFYRTSNKSLFFFQYETVMKTAFIFYITDNKHTHLGDHYGKKYFCKYYKLPRLAQAKTCQKKCCNKDQICH